MVYRRTIRRRLKGGTPRRKGLTKSHKTKSPRSTVTTSKKTNGRKKSSRLGQYRAKKGEFGWMGTKK